MKEQIQNILNYFGYQIIKINRENKYNLDTAAKILIKDKRPIIFDVGANKGQSIIRYNKIFKKPTIHAFEPLKDEIDILKKDYGDDESIIINNLAVGDKEQELEFKLYARRKASSFLNVRDDSKWLDEKIKQTKTNKEKFTERFTTKVITLDNYAKSNNIEKIDILKIDTQGYEDKVLKGAEGLIKRNEIKIIELEIVFSEIYEKNLQIYDVEKILIPNNYKLFGISQGGNLFSNFIYQTDFLYISEDTYLEFKNSKYFNN
tara:strand:+ start:54 stop:836 length:783 start_codon:yes stop_codon:yes gene_type:complete